MLLKWALVFMVVAIIAAIFGFTRISEGAIGIARILFIVFLVVFVILFVMSFVKKI